MRRVLSILILSIVFTSAFISCTPEAITTNDEYQTDQQDSINSNGGAVTPPDNGEE